MFAIHFGKESGDDISRMETGLQPTQGVLSSVRGAANDPFST